MNCKFKTTRIEGVPQWAVAYIVNGDGSGLDDEDLKMVDEWLDGLRKRGIVPLCPIDGSENGFSPYPAFGFGSDTVDFEAEVLPKEREWDLVFNETLVCHISVKARSRDDAIAEANRILSGGLDGWDSMGQKLKSCKLAKEGGSDEKGKR